MKLVAAQRPNGVVGSIFFSAKPLVTDELGLRTALAKDHWARPASTPVLAVAPPLARGAFEPLVRRSERTVTITPAVGMHVRSIAIYERSGAIARIVPARDAPSATTIDLEAGRWVVTAIDRFGREAGFVVVEIP